MRLHLLLAPCHFLYSIAYPLMCVPAQSRCCGFESFDADPDPESEKISLRIRIQVKSELVHET